jgi:xanthine dehydrogenase accessory factor
MQSTDITVLTQLDAWLKQPCTVWLVTVIKTYGSSPRQPGAMCVLRGDGVLIGSVSGGCIEDDLKDKLSAGDLPADNATVITYGATAEERDRFRLPCGGTLDLLIEPVKGSQWVTTVLTHINQHQLVTRTLDLNTLVHTVEHATPETPAVSKTETTVSVTYGPRWRMLIIGTTETSVYLAQMAQALDYHVFVAEPREEMQVSWNGEHGDLLTMMPDDAVTTLKPDMNTAIVALTHDPKLDDMALLEALKSDAFYVGALGSKLNNEKRRERLALFDLTQQEIARLHGPVGLSIGSKTPAEIAIAILGELIQLRHQRSKQTR